MRGRRFRNGRGRKLECGGVRGGRACSPSAPRRFLGEWEKGYIGLRLLASTPPCPASGAGPLAKGDALRCPEASAPRTEPSSNFQAPNTKNREVRVEDRRTKDGERSQAPSSKFQVLSCKNEELDIENGKRETEHGFWISDMGFRISGRRRRERRGNGTVGGREANETQPSTF